MMVCDFCGFYCCCGGIGDECGGVCCVVCCVCLICVYNVLCGDGCMDVIWCWCGVLVFVLLCVIVFVFDEDDGLGVFVVCDK